MLYHYVVEGRLLAQIDNGKPTEIEAGEVIIFPHNHAHLLGSHLDLPPVPSRHRSASPDGGLWVIRHGGGGERHASCAASSAATGSRTIPLSEPCRPCSVSTRGREPPAPG